MSAGNLSGKDPPDKDNPNQEPMNVSVTLSEHEETPAVDASEAPVTPAVDTSVVPATPAVDTSMIPVTYASAVVSNGESNEIVDVLRIVLKKTKPGANYFLKDWEKSRLVFMKLGIP